MSRPLKFADDLCRDEQDTIYDAMKCIVEEYPDECQWFHDNGFRLMTDSYSIYFENANGIQFDPPLNDRDCGWQARLPWDVSIMDSLVFDEDENANSVDFDSTVEDTPQSAFFKLQEKWMQGVTKLTEQLFGKSCSFGDATVHDVTSTFDAVDEYMKTRPAVEMEDDDD